MQEIEFVPCTSSRWELEVEWGDGVMRFSGLSKRVMGLKRFQSTAALRWIGFWRKVRKENHLVQLSLFQLNIETTWEKVLSEVYSQKQRWCFWGLPVNRHLAVLSCTTLFLEMWLSAIFWSFPKCQAACYSGLTPARVHLDEWICVLCYSLVARGFGRLEFPFCFLSDMVHEY